MDNGKDRLAESQTPTLVVAGAKDPCYTEQLFRDTAAGIRYARLILYPRMEHPASDKKFGGDVLALLHQEN